MLSLIEDLNLKEGELCESKYYSDTDSLYIDLSEKSSKESLEIAPGIVIDFDEENHIFGIDIDGASKILNLSQLEILDFPTKKMVLFS